MKPNLQSANGVNGSMTNNGQGTSSGRKSYEVTQVTSDRHQTTAHNLHLNIGTWNVRTLYKSGQLENIKNEMTIAKLDLLGICETRWCGNGRFSSDEYEILYSGGEKHARGVAIIMTKTLSKSLLGCWTVSDRIMLVKFKGKQLDVNVIQAYAPTTEATEEEMENFYKALDTTISTCKSQDIRIVMGDLNAKVGCSEEKGVTGKFGLGTKNERGETFIEWCKVNNICIMNTMFQHHKRRLYTWKSPGDNTRNQIDYIGINNRYRNSIKQCITRPSADCNSDHILLTAKFNCKLKKIRKTAQKPKLNIDLLHSDKTIAQEYYTEVQNRFQQLSDEADITNCNAEEEWSYLQEILTTSAEKILPKQEKQAKQKWITQEILDLMKRRRKLQRNSFEYKALNNKIQRKCKEAKEKWINNQCLELEDLQNKDTLMMYNKIKGMNKISCRTANNALKDKNGNVLFEEESVKKRWVEYIEELFSDDREEQTETVNIDSELSGPPIIKSEIEQALKQMTNKNATGNDGIYKEMITACDEVGIDKLLSIANKIYNSGIIPEQMKQSIFVTIPKKGDLLECKNYRLISLMSHITKAILRIILSRIRNKINPEIGWEQFGFRKHKGTRNAIFTMRTIIERSIQVRKDVYVAFIDYEKAFDRVKHEEIIKDLDKINVDDKDINIKNLYWEQVAATSINNEKSTWARIKRGVRQGCVLSPDLFLLYAETIMLNVENRVEQHFKVNGTPVNTIRYADDTALIANNKEDLHKLLQILKEESEKRGLNINKKKTKIMVFSKQQTTPKCKIIMDGEELEHIEHFNYLGSELTTDGRSTKDIRKRIVLAKQAFNNMKSILTNKKITIKTKVPPNLHQVYIVIWMRSMDNH